MYGCDVDQMHQLGESFQKTATSIVLIESELERLISGLEWEGSDADELRGRWRTRVSQVARDLDDSMRSLKASIDENERAQRQCSSQLAGPSGTGVQGPRRDLADPSTQVDDDTKVADDYEKKNFYDTPLFSEEGPRRQDVEQGALGDCWFMAALASIADTPHGRKMLMDMIHDNGDGTFTVTFADGSTETVDADLYVFNTGDLAYSRGGPLWPHILEKAYAQHLGDSFETIDGDDPPRALRDLVGIETKRVNLGDSAPKQSKLHDTINSALNDNKVIVTSGGGHSWTVVGINDKTIELRNPWGNNQGGSGYAGHKDMWDALGISEKEYNRYDNGEGRLILPISEFSDGWGYVDIEK